MSEMSPFMTYLVIINITGFILYLINTLLYRFTAEGQIDAVLTILYSRYSVDNDYAGCTAVLRYECSLIIVLHTALYAPSSLNG